MAIQPMQNAQHGGIASSSEYNIVVANVVDVDSRLNSVRNDFDTHLDGVSAASASHANIQVQLSALGSTTSNHGSRLTTAESDIDALETSSTDHGTRVTTLEGEMDTAQADISTLQTASTDHGTRLSTAEGDIDDLEAGVSTLEARTTHADSGNEALHARVSIVETTGGGGGTPTILTRTLASDVTSVNGKHHIAWTGSGRNLGGWTFSANNEDIFVPSDGLYMVTLQTSVGSSNSFQVGAYILKNAVYADGAAGVAALTHERTSYSGGQTIWQTVGTIECVEGDKLTARVYLANTNTLFATHYGGTKLLIEKIMS